MVYTLRFFPLQNAVCFIILSYLVPVLFAFYIQGVLKLKKNNSGSKRLIWILHMQLEGQVTVRVLCNGTEATTTTTQWDTGHVPVPPPSLSSCCYAAKCICNNIFLSKLSELQRKKRALFAQITLQACVIYWDIWPVQEISCLMQEQLTFFS